VNFPEPDPQENPCEPTRTSHRNIRHRRRRTVFKQGAWQLAQLAAGQVVAYFLRKWLG
jgi:hypothetical protein